MNKPELHTSASIKTVLRYNPHRSQLVVNLTREQDKTLLNRQNYHKKSLLSDKIAHSGKLTAVDMVAYLGHIGGLTRAATVLEELSLKLDFTKLDADFLKVASAPVFQRLGYILDSVLGEEAIADGLHTLIKAGGMKIKAVPLKLGASVDDAEVDKKWKVMVNQEIVIDNV